MRWPWEINALGNRVTTVYDAIGETKALIGQRDNRHSFTYDAAGNKLAQIDPLSRRTTSGYDAAGRQTLRIDARGNRTTYVWDNNQNVVARKYPNSSVATFTFDAVGNRTLMHDATGRYSYSYDVVNRTLINHQPNSKTITYAYDAIGQRKGMVAPDGGRFTYQYETAGQIQSLENPWNERTTFVYDDAGRRTVKKLANGTRASLTYDDANQLTVLANIDSSSTYISRFDYEYDSVGNRTEVLEVDGSRVTWSYDVTNQLLTEHRTGTTPHRNSFTYDSAQNRMTKNEDGAITTSTFDAANQLETSFDSGGTTTFTFDNNGNQHLVEAPNGDRTTTVWDFENQPTKIILPLSTINTATYDADNLRVELRDSEGTKRFIWDGQQYLMQTDDSNITQAVWTNEPDKFTNLVSQRRGGATQYPHFDALGSMRQLTDASENITDTLLYDAWGNVLAHAGVTIFPLQFVGMSGYYFDSDTNTIYIIHRVYEPQTGRWWSLDPIGFASEDMNLFCYASNNSANRIDPSGYISRELVEQNIGVNGQFSINWKFSLDRPQREDVVIVQFIQVQSLIWECKPCRAALCCNRKKIIRNCYGLYYEVIGFIQRGETEIRKGFGGAPVLIKRLAGMGRNVQLPRNTQQVKEDDDTWIQIPTGVNSCGIHQMRGSVKAFTLTGNILAQIKGWNVVRQGANRPTICNMSSGFLAGERATPRFWNRNIGVFRPVETESPVAIRAIWHCPPAKTSFTILGDSDATSWPVRELPNP